ncbi:MAG TPA: hypothetical protein VM141_01205, partial [Planctomycetota bacterium]|nr:hypothetical protein [Planctomycetota bacterium]
MPRIDSHINLAVHNIECACHLNATPRFHDWTATVAFYAAIHVVEAVFANEKPILHGQCHQRREQLLKQKYQNIYIPYHALRDAADVARYLDKADCFSLFMDPSQVQAILLQQKLTSILRLALQIAQLKPQ